MLLQQLAPSQQQSLTPEQPRPPQPQLDAWTIIHSTAVTLGLGRLMVSLGLTRSFSFLASGLRRLRRLAIINSSMHRQRLLPKSQHSL